MPTTDRNLICQVATACVTSGATQGKFAGAKTDWDKMEHTVDSMTREGLLTFEEADRFFELLASDHFPVGYSLAEYAC